MLSDFGFIFCVCVYIERGFTLGERIMFYKLYIFFFSKGPFMYFLRVLIHWCIHSSLFLLYPIYFFPESQISHFSSTLQRHPLKNEALLLNPESHDVFQYFMCYYIILKIYMCLKSLRVIIWLSRLCKVSCFPNFLRKNPQKFLIW